MRPPGRHAHPDGATRTNEVWIPRLFLAAAVVGTAGVFGGTIAAAADVAPTVHAEHTTEPRPHVTATRTLPTLSVAPVPLTTVPTTTRPVPTTTQSVPQTVTVVPVTDKTPVPGVLTTAEREPVSSQTESAAPATTTTAAATSTAAPTTTAPPVPTETEEPMPTTPTLTEMPDVDALIEEVLGGE